jgi:hypothetical protein
MVEGFRVDERVTGVEGGAMGRVRRDGCLVSGAPKEIRRKPALSRLPSALFNPCQLQDGHQTSYQDISGYLSQGKHQDRHRVLRVLRRSSPSLSPLFPRSYDISADGDAPM